MVAKSILENGDTSVCSIMKEHLNSFCLISKCFVKIKGVFK